MTGKLILVATPIGNLGDLSPRAAAALESADAWLVEDSRVSGKLAAHLQLKKSMLVLNDHTGAAQLQNYIEQLRQGRTLALLTDGGSPAISDPGAAITDICREEGIPVESIPGPSAVTQALALSGFFAQRFAFLGFLPRKPGPMREELRPFADSPYTLVLFESPFRIANLIEAAYAELGPRRYAICREMTKTFEQVFRQDLPYVPTERELPRKGEVTLVVEGRRKRGEES